MTRYWSYTVKYVPSSDAPEDMHIFDTFITILRHKGDEYWSECIDAQREGMDPAAVVAWLNDRFRFPSRPTCVLVDQRATTQEEYEAWEAEQDRFAEAEVAYLTDSVDEPPSW